MLALSPVFQDFWLPNATTWFYFSLLLAVALFFKFSRLLSMRNWDVVTIFLLVPGILLIEDAQPATGPTRGTPPARVPAAPNPAAESAADSWVAAAGLGRLHDQPPQSSLQWGYAWLLLGSGYFLLRCLFDLALVQRPALQPNLNFGGLAWLAGALFVCLTAVAFRPENHRGPQPAPAGPISVPTEKDTDIDKVGRESAALDLGQRGLPAWATRTMAVVCHLVVVIGLIVFAKVHFQDPLAGMAAATFYLMLPYTGHYVSYLLHVWPVALIVWALVAYRIPWLAGGLLGLAAGTIYFPFLLLPMWLSFYWGRGAGRFALGFLTTASVALAVTGVILLWSDDLGQSLAAAVDSSDWQPWRVPTAEGIWQGIHWAYRVPVFIAFLAFVVVTATWPSPKNLGHLIALTAAVLIGMQFWYADKGGQYVLWYLPLLLLLVFRPNLADRRPAPVVGQQADWVSRAGAAVVGVVAWLLRSPEAGVRAR